MKAIVQSQGLAKELKKISPLIKKTTVLPILSCVQLCFEKSKLTITGTDLETTVVATMDCECKTAFTIVVDFESLIDVCSKIFELISIDVTGEDILITSDDSKFKFTKTNEEHFPAIEKEEFNLYIDVDEDFFYALSSANSCKSDDQFKVSMNEACIHLKKDSITVIGTDAFLAYKKDFKIKTGKESKVMVGEQFVQLAKSFTEGKVSIGDKFVKAESGTMTVISLLSESKFCAYEGIIPSEIEFNFKANRKDLINSLSFASVAAAKSTHLCAINFNGEGVKVESKDIDYGKDAETKVKAIHTVEIKAIGVNGSQMLKLLNFFDSEEIEIAFRGENNTMFLRPFGEPGTLCLLQPLALSSNV